MDKTLSWALVIATYNRQNILPQCLQLAAAQTCPPSQIIVVDSSDDWQETHDRVMTEIAVNYPAINWMYVEATERSSASQRNQGARLSNADVLFTAFLSLVRYSNKTRLASVSVKVLFSMYLTSMENAVSSRTKENNTVISFVNKPQTLTKDK
ncbi:glycosyltransferase family 2 protein [Coleofasciculus sp.]|uniref:glycosyltransferase family 2 protein n=1 Tax=Coleofasciculus sp. TaxID=3100458 RepID=UPI003A283D1F